MIYLCHVSIFQVDPKKSHVIAIKRIFRYLKWTIDFGLWYSKNDDFTLTAFTNDDWVGDVDDWKKYYRWCILFGK